MEMGRVLIVGPDFFGYNFSIARAFEKSGFETKVISYKGNIINTFSEQLKYHISSDKASFFEKKKENFNKLVEAAFRDFDPTLVFIVHGGYILYETYKVLSEKRVVIWMMDSISRADDLSHLLDWVDYHFFFEKTDVELFKNVYGRVSWFLPLALDETVYFPLEREKDIDLLFIGALYENRIRLLEKVVKTFPERKIKVYGKFYSPLRKPIFHFTRSNKNIFLNKNIFPESVNQLYSRSKVCLNIHHAQSKYGVNQRFFEISGSRSLQVVEGQQYILDNFSPNEICTYSNDQEMLSGIEKGLSDAEWRRSLASAAYKKVISEHTFYHRIQTILETIG